MSYQGWRGVTDPKGILIAVTWEPVGHFLACLFKGGAQAVHEGVPEKQYLAIIRSPFGGSYFRKYVSQQYPIVPLSPPPLPHQMSQESKQAAATKTASARAKRYSPQPEMEQTLFGYIPRRKA